MCTFPLSQGTFPLDTGALDEGIGKEKVVLQWCLLTNTKGSYAKENPWLCST